MTTFVGAQAQKNHFDSYIQWFEFIEDSAIFVYLIGRRYVSR